MVSSPQKQNHSRDRTFSSALPLSEGTHTSQGEVGSLPLVRTAAPAQLCARSTYVLATCGQLCCKTLTALSDYHQNPACPPVAASWHYNWAQKHKGTEDSYAEVGLERRKREAQEAGQAPHDTHSISNTGSASSATQALPQL